MEYEVKFKMYGADVKYNYQSYSDAIEGYNKLLRSGIAKDVKLINKQKRSKQNETSI